MYTQLGEQEERRKIQRGVRQLDAVRRLMLERRADFVERFGVFDGNSHPTYSHAVYVDSELLSDVSLALGTLREIAGDSDAVIDDRVRSLLADALVSGRQHCDYIDLMKFFPGFRVHERDSPEGMFPGLSLQQPPNSPGAVSFYVERCAEVLPLAYR